MSPRTSRPTTEPKGNRENFRLSDKDIEKLKFCIEKTGIKKLKLSERVLIWSIKS